MILNRIAAWILQYTTKEYTLSLNFHFIAIRPFLLVALVGKSHTFIAVTVQSAHHAAEESLVQDLQQLQRRGMNLNSRTARHQERHGYHGCVMVARIFPVIRVEDKARALIRLTK